MRYIIYISYISTFQYIWKDMDTLSAGKDDESAQLTACTQVFAPECGMVVCQHGSVPSASAASPSARDETLRPKLKAALSNVEPCTSVM